MNKHQINVFISHSWSYSEHYETLYDWIFKRQWSIRHVPLDFQDFSVPRDDPIHNASNSYDLRDAIYRRIYMSHVVVIPMGMYANYSGWIQKEIDGAGHHLKPILGVNPWGQQRSSSVVQAAANKTVGWNKESVVRGIWELF